MKIENYLINVEKLLDNMIITKDLNKRLNKIFKIKCINYQNARYEYTLF